MSVAHRSELHALPPTPWRECMRVARMEESGRTLRDGAQSLRVVLECDLVVQRVVQLGMCHPERAAGAVGSQPLPRRRWLLSFLTDSLVPLLGTVHVLEQLPHQVRSHRSNRLFPPSPPLSSPLLWPQRCRPSPPTRQTCSGSQRSSQSSPSSAKTSSASLSRPAERPHSSPLASLSPTPS